MVQWAHVTRTRKPAPEEEPVCLWQPDAAPKPISPAEKSQDHASEAALLLGLQLDAMQLRDTPPASPCTSTITQECATDKGSSTGEQQICWLSPTLQLPAWVIFNKWLHSSLCPSYSPNHLYLLSEILGDSFTGRCWLRVKQCCCFGTIPCWERQQKQCMGLQTEARTTTEAG